ncbi:serine hydroxymethyltransferase [Candidatus Gottesmanbacteria bacterium]|nr:serine hydroxymethyltransferase [Candidatus Gottesmanbacteria bacterium]
MKTLKNKDPQIYKLIGLEKKRQVEGLEMIPSENYTSESVMEAVGSILTNKYSEGYPGKRYYGGNQIIDDVERLAQDRIKKLFDVPFVNVQPYSGSPANLAVCLAILKPGETLMGQGLTAGGHLTHGWKVSATGIFFNSVQYGVDRSKPDLFNYEEIEALSKKHKPKLIWVGATAHPLIFNYKKFADIAESVNAYLVADIAHIAGLIVAGVHPSPVPFVDVITSTTHKTFRGPRGAMIMVTNKGLKKDPDLPDKIDKAVFPGLQGGPHDHVTAGIAVAAKEASTAQFKKYGAQIVKNTKALADELTKNGIIIVGGRGENHLILIDLTSWNPGLGVFASHALEIAGITANKNTVPGEKSSPFYPSGLRLGTPALTTRGMREKDMKRIGEWVAKILQEIKDFKLPTNKEERKEYLKKQKAILSKNKNLLKIKKEIVVFSRRFPVPGIK